MAEGAASPLAGWETFYVILGSSAAALTGLQFVVTVLGSEVNIVGEAATRAFGTPTIVHFCAVLLLAAITTAPWPEFADAAIAFGFCVAAGVAYVLMVLRHTRR